MAEESIFSLQRQVIEYRQKLPHIINECYEKIYKLKDNVTFEEPPVPAVEIPKLNWPENLDWSSAESLHDEKMEAKIKEQTKLLILLQKEKKHPFSKIINSVYKNNNE